MRNIVGNAWDLLDEYDAFCLTTNGTIKKDGSCVMGRGIALEAKMRYPGIDKVLGKSIAKHGNVSSILGEVGTTDIVSYVVKHNWYEEADIKLIESSALKLMQLADDHGWGHIILPRPGCGNGKLKWEVVKPIISRILDDRFDVITFR